MTRPMRSARRLRRRQSGFALLFMLVVVVLGVTYAVLNRLNAATDSTPARREHNARVLAEARRALIGHVLMRAGQSGVEHPGSFPCPEAAAYYNNPAQEGEAAGSCSVPAVGRLPWRTLGINKLTDAQGEPLWYVVSPGWHKAAPTGANSYTVINPYSVGQLTVDGVANDAVALIIAPGAALLSNAPGCAGVMQTRSMASIDPVNYLDCDNATSGDASYTTSGPAGSFNDQVVRITARELIPLLEEAILPRIEREIVPALRNVYASDVWGSNVSSANPFYPYAAPFVDPGAGASYRGSAASCAGDACQGLLPAVFINDPVAGVCTKSTASACDPNFVRWTGGTIEVSEATVSGTVYSATGTVIGGLLDWDLTVRNCTIITQGATGSEYSALRCAAAVPGLAGSFSNNVRYRVRGTALNVGNAFRQFDTAGAMPGMTIQTPPTVVTMSTAGTASVTFEGRMNVPPTGLNLLSIAACGLSLFGSLPGLECREVIVTIPITLFGDAPVVNPRHPDLGWFSRNEWYRLFYFAASADVTPARGSSSANCDSGVTCLDLDGQHNKRALMFYAGRSLIGTVGPSRTLTDFLEDTTPADPTLDANRDLGKRFESQQVGSGPPRSRSSTFNDRVMVIQVDT